MTALGSAKLATQLPDLMAHLGLGEHAKKSARCPFHEDRHNSFSVFQSETGEWMWNCFAGCGGGDVVAFIARFEGISNGEACQRLIGLTGARSTGMSRPASHRRLTPGGLPNLWPLGVMPEAVAQAWNEGVDHLLAHPASALQLATFRGWPVAFAQYVIDCAAIASPLHYNERGIAFQVVAPEGERGAMTTRPLGYHIRLKGKPGEKASWRFVPSEKEHGQGIPALPYIIGEFARARLLVITEGQWDALTFALAAGWLGEGCLWPQGVGLIGVRGAHGDSCFLKYYQRFWPERTNCLLLADTDNAGKSWSQGPDCFATKLNKLGARVAVVDCSPRKDFNDLYRMEKPGKDEIADLLVSYRMAVESEVAA